jgi:hypothetical protein
MTRKLYLGLTLLMWLVLPATVLQFRANWEQLPVHMATHFNAANQPNGWMTREQAMWAALEMLAALLIVFTLVLVFSHLRQPIASFSWALLAFFYVIVGLGWFISTSILNYNLYGRSNDAGLVGVIFGVSLVGILIAYLMLRRERRLPASPLIAEEVHAVRGWAALFVPIIVVQLGVIAFVPNPSLRLGLSLVCLVLLMALAAAWNGFHYYFTPHGLEVRSLGFRLRSVPAERIRNYSAQKWNPIGGYGIRGVGNSRAYVWGNRGVRIVTSDGYIFLGHREPERIVHDLDEMMKAGK